MEASAFICIEQFYFIEVNWARVNLCIYIYIWVKFVSCVFNFQISQVHAAEAHTGF